MATFKVKQKLTANAFQQLRAQVKAEGVKIISRNTDGNVIIVGKITDALNLGRKVEVYTDEDGIAWLNDNSAFAIYDGKWVINDRPVKGK